MGWLDALPTYKSGDTPKYKIGDKVYRLFSTVTPLKKKMQKFCVPCEITGVSEKKSGFIFKEFTYTIKSAIGEVVEDVYESELYTEYQNVPVLENPDITLEEVVEQLYEDSL